MGGCGGGNSQMKSSNHAPKKMPNWGMNKPSGAKKSSSTNNAYGSFGKPAVRMSFGSGKSRRGY